tara:strand:+ start:1601 stop:1867 length:267 start_codon:yes stop_codon:yes gene_type:complete
MFTIEINKSHSAITVRHEEKGKYTVPIGSVSWYKLESKEKAKPKTQVPADEQMKKLLDLPGPPRPSNKGSVARKKPSPRAKPTAVKKS